jgi:hypothetical protein
MRTTWGSVLVLASSLALCGSTWSQSPPPPAGQEPPPPGAEARPQETREALRDRLARRLENTKRVQQRLEQALKQLDEGTPVERVRDGLERDARDQFDAARRNGTGGPRFVPRRPGAEDAAPMPGAGPGPNGREGGPGSPRPGGRVFDRDRLLDLIQKNNPDFAQHLRDLQHDNPQAADMMWKRLDPQLRELLNEHDPDVQSLRIAELKNGWATLGKVRELHDAMRRGNASEVEEKTGVLRGLFAERYDLQVRLQQSDIANLEKRLAQLREEATHNAADAKDKFVRERVEEMTARVKDRLEREKNRPAPPPGGPQDGMGEPPPNGR